MPRGGHRPGAGRPKGSKNKNTVKSGYAPETKRDGVKNKELTPLDYMLDIMRDENEPQDRRDKMAYFAAPYIHPKASVKTGKKEEREERAKQAGTGRFAASKPPLKIIR